MPIVGRYTDVEEKEVVLDGAEGVRMRVLIGEDQGAPNVVLRRFSINPGGKTPYHTHSWEHEVYVLGGRGKVRQGGKSWDITTGSTVFVIPGEEHNFENTGEELLEFLCIVPVVKG